MKPIQYRISLRSAVEALGVDWNDIPKNMISSYIRRMRKVINISSDEWMRNGLYRSEDLDKKASKLLLEIIPGFALRLRKEFLTDVLSHP